MSSTTIQKEIRTFIGEGKPEAALQRLRAVLSEQSEYLHPVLTRSCEAKLWNKQFIGGVISEKEWLQHKNALSMAILALLDELDDSDFMPNLPDTTDWQAALEQLQMRKMGNLQLVNCDRQPEHLTFTHFFRDHEKTPFQFYFLLACPTQKPGSFAERVIYEIIDEVLIDDEAAIDFEREQHPLGTSTIERVRVQPLPVGMDAVRSEKKFRLDFARRMERFNLAHSTTLEEFVQTKAKQLPFQYVCFVYEIEAADWDREVSKFVEWLLETFRHNHDSRPSFLFFFVVNQQGAHLSGAGDSLAATEIRRIAAAADDTCWLMQCPQPVGLDDIATWFRKISPQANPAEIEAIIQAYAQDLQQKKRWDGRAAINMTEVEELQKAVYFAYLKKKIA